MKPYSIGKSLEEESQMTQDSRHPNLTYNCFKCCFLSAVELTIISEKFEIKK